jgi:hypothetical protein
VPAAAHAPDVVDQDGGALRHQREQQRTAQDERQGGGGRRRHPVGHAVAAGQQQRPQLAGDQDGGERVAGPHRVARATARPASWTAAVNGEPRRPATVIPVM